MTQKKKNKTRQHKSKTTPGNIIEAENRIPEIKMLDLLNNQLHVLLLRFALLNTHVAFHFEFPALKKGEDGFDARTTTVISLPVPTALAVATDQHLQGLELNHHSNNLSSIHYFSLSDFKRFILGISLENENISVYELVSKNFREASNIKKDKIPSITLGELKQDQQKIQGLYTLLKNTLPPKTKLELPFHRKFRQQSIHDRIEVSVFI